MSVLVVGLSHRTAPVSLLEQVVLDEGGVATLLLDAVSGEHVTEAVVVSTCNRLEVYADVARYHGGVAELSDLLARHTGVALETLTPHLYLRYEDQAVEHLFALVCGLESMVLGEAQILGQVRSALRTAQSEGTAGRALNDLLQQALRVGKRAHAETGIDRAAPSLVSAGLEIASRELGDLAAARAVIVGAGSIGALAGAHLRRADSELVFVNRTALRADRLAANHGGRAASFAELPGALATAEVVVSCTGAVGTVLDAPMVAAARRGSDQPLVIIDLALPHDVDPEVGELPGVVLVGLEQLAELGASRDPESIRDLEDVRGIVRDEVTQFLSGQRAERVAPVVVALRVRAGEVVDAELTRLDTRMPDLDPVVREELAIAIRRAVDKLLHEPTVRMKELAAHKGGDQYAAALRQLFDLDPEPVRTANAVDAVNAAEAITRAELARACTSGAS